MLFDVRQLLNIQTGKGRKEGRGGWTESLSTDKWPEELAWSLKLEKRNCSVPDFDERLKYAKNLWRVCRARIVSPKLLMYR